MPPELTEQFSRLKSYLVAAADTGWSSYASVENALREVTELEVRIKAGDRVAKEKMTHLLAPTGVLQEISMANGWADEFIRISAILDAYLLDLFRNPNEVDMI